MSGLVVVWSALLVPIFVLGATPPAVAPRGWSPKAALGRLHFRFALIEAPRGPDAEISALATLGALALSGLGLCAYSFASHGAIFHESMPASAAAIACVTFLVLDALVLRIGWRSLPSNYRSAAHARETRGDSHAPKWLDAVVVAAALAAIFISFPVHALSLLQVTGLAPK